MRNLTGAALATLMLSSAALAAPPMANRGRAVPRPELERGPKLVGGSDMEGAGGGPGATWSSRDAGTTSNLYAVWAAEGGVAFAVGQGGTILRTTDHGSHWARLNSGTAVDLRSVWGSSAREVFAVGQSGTILATVDGGESWAPRASSTSAPLNAISGAGGKIFVVGAGGTILSSADGQQFSALSSGTTANLEGVHVTTDGHVFAVGRGHTVLHSADHGASWAAVALQGREDFHTLRSGPKGDLYLAGLNGGLWHSGDLGASWEPRENPAKLPLYAFAPEKDGVIATGAGGAIVHARGGEWRGDVSDTVSPLLGVATAPDGDVYAVGFGGTILTYP